MTTLGEAQFLTVCSGSDSRRRLMATKGHLDLTANATIGVIRNRNHKKSSQESVPAHAILNRQEEDWAGWPSTMSAMPALDFIANVDTLLRRCAGPSWGACG
ncbi:MAG: hypothetical protein P8076_14335 [Gammaproteobacteria bacterium]